MQWGAFNGCVAGGVRRWGALLLWRRWCPKEGWEEGGARASTPLTAAVGAPAQGIRRARPSQHRRIKKARDMGGGQLETAEALQQELFGAGEGGWGWREHSRPQRLWRSSSLPPYQEGEGQRKGCACAEERACLGGGEAGAGQAGAAGLVWLCLQLQPHERARAAARQSGATTQGPEQHSSSMGAHAVARLLHPRPMDCITGMNSVK